MYEVEGVSPGQSQPIVSNILTLISIEVEDLQEKLLEMKLKIREKLLEGQLNTMTACAANLSLLNPQYSGIEKQVGTYADAAKKLNGMSETDPEYAQSRDNLIQAYNQIKIALNP